MLFRKAISPVVATVLLLVVTVLVVVGFQSWFAVFSNSMFLDVEKENSMDSMVRVEGIIDDKLYIKSNSRDNFEMFKIVDSRGGVMCELGSDVEGNLQSETNLFLNFDGG